MTETSDNWKEAYINDLRPLSESEQNRLAAVTIVGMRYYDKGNTRAWVQDFRQENAKKCLYLVPEPGNAHDKNAIMLHDGKKRVAYVQTSEAPHLAEMLKGTEDVYCVYVSQVGHSPSTYEPTFLRVKAFCKVDERLARKYTCEPASKTTPSTHKQKEAAKKTLDELRSAIRVRDQKVDSYDDAWIPEWKCKQYGFDE